MMNLARLPLPHFGESKEEGLQHRHEWTEENEAKIQLK